MIGLQPVEVDTIIVGSGMGGLGMGIRLARETERSFLILERAHDVGGTWRDNTYPGVACDIPSHLYSFSYRTKSDWGQFYADGAQIHRYLQDAARQEGLLPHLRFGTDVRQMRWQPDVARWQLDTTTGSYRCRVLIIAAGRLSEPRIPEIPGLTGFAGPVFHSSAWDHSVELAGQRVGVVGTGASAIQIAPNIARVAESVVLFQRTAAYVVPRADRTYSDAEMRLLAQVPGEIERLRSQLFWEAEAGFAKRVGLPAAVAEFRDVALGHLASQVSDPELRARLTPSYEIGCKRVVLSDEFYPALSTGAVALEPSALDSLHSHRATAASGAEYELDVLVLATGFHTTQPPFATRVFGREGIALSDRWSRGMVAHASTTVAGFPNLFVIDGPNASLGHNSAVHMIETQIGFILGALDHLELVNADVLEVGREAEDAWMSEIDRRSASTVWLTGGCSSWYVDDRSDRLTLLWPDFAFAFRDEVGTFDPRGYRVSRAPVAVAH
ncbi:NAD(P)/FAD-dependent oxidoreductase [Frigoribacterium sp. CG_9.8]|uniref:flavin-containing monooxygenase n=1 Tax=Frigoribacterium sp. CG_9.8 TaxID=2787733 RepID=UPI0018CAABE7|nr:NAD(P)/FAD-dependent oxidoreductase [Frigoribacterium sp. CG_9.8]MBG6106921.1 cation diffusion facilitator CzcD-associated flavoprotein CzcO [Frigoribacterium sp. CG_9.8]